MTHAQPIAGDRVRLAGQLLRIKAEKSLDEVALGQDTIDEPADDVPELHIQDDNELEDESEST